MRVSSFRPRLKCFVAGDAPIQIPVAGRLLVPVLGGGRGAGRQAVQPDPVRPDNGPAPLLVPLRRRDRLQGRRERPGAVPVRRPGAARHEKAAVQQRLRLRPVHHRTHMVGHLHRVGAARRADRRTGRHREHQDHGQVRQSQNQAAYDHRLGVEAGGDATLSSPISFSFPAA